MIHCFSADKFRRDDTGHILPELANFLSFPINVQLSSPRALNASTRGLARTFFFVSLSYCWFQEFSRISGFFAVQL